MRRAKRARKGETHSRAAARMRAARSALLRKRPAHKWAGALADAISKSAGKMAGGKEAVVRVFHVPGENSLLVSLDLGDLWIATAEVKINKSKQVVDAAIESVQGVASERDVRSVERQIGARWNIALARPILEGAYHAGFDRVLLKDITKTASYRQPELLPGQTVGGAQKRMHGLYTRLKGELSFTKRERGYWVREFP